MIELFQMDAMLFILNRNIIERLIQSIYRTRSHNSLLLIYQNHVLAGGGGSEGGHLCQQ